MKTLHVAMLQLLPGKTLEENLNKGLRYCAKAKAMGADIALFPEMWSNGYTLGGRGEKLQTEALAADSVFLQAFSQFAQKHFMAVGITFLEKFEPAPRNTLLLYNRCGKEALRYAKVHTCVFGEERCLTPGEDFYVAPLDTACGPVQVGAMICYDREFPESARILMLKGAELVLVPNACPMEINRLSQLRARAFENMMGIATVNYPFGKPDCNGHSSAFDGMAYRPGSTASRDTLLVEAGEGEGIYMASFPLEDMREYRADEVHGNAYRRPQTYELLLSKAVEPPFIRD